MTAPLPSALTTEAVDGFLDHIETLIDQGMYLQVHPHLEALASQANPQAVLLAARCLPSLGDDRTGESLVLRNFRRHPRDGASIVAMLRQRFYRYGPYEAWRCFGRHGLPEGESPTVRAEYLSLRAGVQCSLRDFSEMARLQGEARELDPGNPWLWVEWSYCCERADRYDEALAAAEKALELFAGYRSAVQQRAKILVFLGRHAEAKACLTREFARSESAFVGMQLFDLQYEESDYAAAGATLTRVESLQPRADKWSRSRLAARRADVAMGQGDLENARLEAARVEKSSFYANTATRIADGVSPRRVMLPVGFVRQHWMTCAPATLAAISSYFQRPAEHLEIAQEICYDGTPDVSERAWASGNGFLVREFRVDWDSARALLDAGIPFTLATSYTGSGHLQAVIGYDLLRNSLLIRDPFEPIHGEFDADELFKSQRSSGPRGMVLVPPELADTLASIALPDADIWDRYHALVAALGRHDRDAALAALESLKAAGDQHRLCLQGARSLAIYDGNETEILRCTEALLERYPEDANFQLSKAASLWSIGGRAAHLDWLAELARGGNPDAQVLLRYADRLGEDGRRLPEALAMAKRVLRRVPANSRAWRQLADLLWQSGEYRSALACYRHAACLADTDEGMAGSYHRACHLLGESDTGFAFLAERVAHLGSKSPAPAITLFEQLDNLERVDEACAVLEAALRQHPADADLLAYCAEVRIRYGRLDEARELLSRIGTGLRRGNWLRVNSLLAEAQGDFEAALAHAREASGLEPLNLRHHRLVVAQLARRQGRDAAVAWLRQACERYPFHFGLQRLCYDWLPDNPGGNEALLRHMAGTHPGDAWVLRELATQLTRQGRYEAAEEEARAAVELAPGQSESHGVLAYVVMSRDGYGPALPHLQKAVSLDVDNDYALGTLISRAPGADQARAAIDFARQELVRQVTTGDGLLTFQQTAQEVLSPEELLAILKEALDARPDLWHAWAAYGVQLVEMGRIPEALPVFEDALGRFSMLPRLYVEKAEALKLLGRREEARRNLERALAINPAWNRAVRLFVDIVTEENGDWERAEAILAHALAREPDDADLRGLQGWLLEQLERPEAALEAVGASLRLDPRPRWVWEMASRLGEALESPEVLESLMDEVENSRPGDPWAWVARARLGRDDDQALGAAERAIALDSRLIPAWDARLERLLALKRWEEVESLLAAMSQWPDGVPVDLRLHGAQASRARGDREGAVARLQALLAEAPNDYRLWRTLADWYDEDDAKADYVAAARELVRLAPNFAPALGYLGHALVKDGQGAAAMPLLARAQEIDPTYVFAGRQLIETGLELGQLEAAAQAADIVWPHHPLLELAVGATRVACRRGRRDEAQQWLERTLARAGYDGHSAEAAMEVVREAGWGDLVATVTEACIRTGACAHAAALAWVEGKADRWWRRWYLLPRLDSLIREEGGAP